MAVDETPGAQALYLLYQDGGIDDHTVADHAEHVRVENTRWKQVELELLIAHGHRVARRCSRPDSARPLGPDPPDNR